MKKLLIILNIIPFCLYYTSAQNLHGVSGLFFIPTAGMNSDGKVTIGTSYIDKSVISFGDFRDNAVTPFLSINFLPFIEFNFKVTRLINTKVTTQGIGDRNISVRLRILKETENIPALVIGFHDIAAVYGGSGAVHDNALYVVASKHFYINSLINNIGFHTGYGLDKIKAQHHNFVGLFGGLSLKIFNTLELMTEYDGKHSNSGIRIKLFNHLSILGGFLQNKHFSGGAAFSFQL